MVLIHVRIEIALYAHHEHETSVFLSSLNFVPTNLHLACQQGERILKPSSVSLNEHNLVISQLAWSLVHV
jgi:hypothetical protein